MKEKKLDRRVRYTKKVIKEAFINLMQTKDISKITVKEICEEADINRATFYAYYANPYDLLNQIQTQFLNDIQEYLTHFPHNHNREDGLVLILEYIKKNVEVTSLLLGDKNQIGSIKQLMEIINDELILDRTANKIIADEDVEYLIIFFLLGSVGIIQKWIQDDMKKPTKEIATMILKLTVNNNSW